MSFNYTVGSGFTKADAAGNSIYRFTISGEVDFPVLTQIDSPRYVKDAFTFSKATITTSSQGNFETTQYYLKVTSTDLDGLNPIVHVNVFNSIDVVQDLFISVATIPANRLLYFELNLEQGEPQSDLTLTLS